ncbi:hypothetical protein GCM10009804_23380 [Kribbella hippodromi]|uniref:Saccharopine dehydrogenase NADP binding domain-containing protein n=1 Tax=Kribbella hippodromi TaxID=434347 RepID=A0ABN2CZ84_9ACTN
MNPVNTVVVYGATGHTGRFVVEELLRRAIPTTIAGRNPSTLTALTRQVALPRRTALPDQLALPDQAAMDGTQAWDRAAITPAAVDDPRTLDRVAIAPAAVDDPGALDRAFAREWDRAAITPAAVDDPRALDRAAIAPAAVDDPRALDQVAIVPAAVDDRRALDGAFARQWDRVAIASAAVDDPGALDRAFAGQAAVINCAGPFALTAIPVLEAAARNGVPYVDVAAELEANVTTLGHPSASRAVPACAFFGGLADLLAAAALDGDTKADRIEVAYGLPSWHPTPGTRVAGEVSHERRGGRRVRFTDGQLRYHQDAPVHLDWTFPEPLGRRRVIAEFSMADIVTIPSHIDVSEVRSLMTVDAAADLADPNTPAPVAVDALGRSEQTFVVDVRVHTGGVERRAIARGQDIYAISAPLAVEAVQRLLDGRTRSTGVASAGAMFDAADFLNALPLEVEVH